MARLFGYPRTVSSWPLVTATANRQTDRQGEDSGVVDLAWTVTGMTCTLLGVCCGVMGEVLRHSAALSCWHRKMGGFGSPWKASQAGLQLDQSASVRIGSCPASGQNLRRHEGQWEERVRSRTETTPSEVSGGAKNQQGVMRCAHIHTHSTRHVSAAPLTLTQCDLP